MVILLYIVGFFKIINTISGGFLVLNDPNKSIKVLLMNIKLSDKITANFLKRSLYAMLFKFFTNNFIFFYYLIPSY